MAAPYRRPRRGLRRRPGHGGDAPPAPPGGRPFPAGAAPGVDHHLAPGHRPGRPPGRLRGGRQAPLLRPPLRPLHRRRRRRRGPPGGPLGAPARLPRAPASCTASSPGSGCSPSALLVLRPQGSLPGIAAPFLLYGLLLPLRFRWLLPSRLRRRRRSVPPPPLAPLPAARRRRPRAGRPWSAWPGAAWPSPAPSPCGASSPRPARAGPPAPLLDMGATPGSRGTRPGPDGLPAEATSSADFYVVSKNLRDPRPDPRGLAPPRQRPRRPPLRAHPGRAAGPPPPGAVADHGLHQQRGGRRLRRQRPLARRPGRRPPGPLRGLPPRASRIVLRAADDYSDSIPLALARDPATLVVTAMNGEPLPAVPRRPRPPPRPRPVRHQARQVAGVDRGRGHHLPRLLAAPGLERLRRDQDHLPHRLPRARHRPRRPGHAHRRDGLRRRPGHLPRRGQRGRRRHLAPGPASRPPGAPSPGSSGRPPGAPRAGPRCRLTVRAVDGSGQVQTTEAAPALPDGASGLHSVTVRVS